jgi:L-lactate utilization protein LutB
MGMQDEIKSRFLKELEKSHGVLTQACTEAHVKRVTIYRYLKKWPDFKERVEEIRRNAIDYVETQLWKLIEQGDTPSVLFFLRCRGKDRGYIDKVEHTGNITGNFNLTINKKIIKSKDDLNESVGDNSQ